MHQKNLIILTDASINIWRVYINGFRYQSFECIRKIIALLTTPSIAILLDIFEQRFFDQVILLDFIYWVLDLDALEIRFTNLHI